MTEFVGLAFTAVILAQSTAKVIQLARIISTFKHPKADGFAARFYTAQAKLEEWQKRMNINNETDLRRVAQQLPPETRTKMLRIYEALHIWMGDVDKILKKYGLVREDGPIRGQRIETLRKQLTWATRDADDVEILLTTIESLVKGLKTIAPPPPGYYLHAKPGEHASLSMTPTDRSAIVMEPSTTTSRATAPGAAGVADDDIVIDERREFEPTIKLLFKSTLQNLRALWNKVGGDNWKRALRELQLWGTGLFEGPLPLDNLLSSKSLKTLRAYILGVLADIGITIGYVYNHVQLQVDEASFDSEHRNVLRVVLGQAEIAAVGLDDYKLLQGPKNEDEKSKYLDECCEDILELTDCLFDILAPIQTMQHQEFLRVLEGTSVPPTESVTAMSTIDDTVESGPIVQLAILNNELLSLTEETLAKRNFNEGHSDGVVEDLQKKITQFQNWVNISAPRIDAYCKGENTTAINRATQVALIRIARAFEMGYPTQIERKGLTKNDIDERIQTCYVSIGEDESFDFKGKSISSPEEAVEVLKSSMVTLQELSEEVRLARSPLALGSGEESAASSKAAEAQSKATNSVADSSSDFYPAVCGC